MSSNHAFSEPTCKGMPTGNTVTGSDDGASTATTPDTGLLTSQKRKTTEQCNEPSKRGKQTSAPSTPGPTEDNTDRKTKLIGLRGKAAPKLDPTNEDMLALFNRVHRTFNVNAWGQCAGSNCDPRVGTRLKNSISFQKKSLTLVEGLQVFAGIYFSEMDFCDYHMNMVWTSYIRSRPTLRRFDTNGQ